MIRLAEQKDFNQLANMRWEHKAEDDVVYGEKNIVNIDKDEFVNDFVSFLNEKSTYRIYVLELDNQIISARYVELIRKVPGPK
ncbi:MAG: hypothetical protein WBH77_01260 [Saccharofermentanales bacterium]